MQLVIAEKPSVAMSIAAVLGADKRQDGYMEGNGYLVGWCVGHLAGLADASHYGDYKKWRYEDLPILPETWQTVIAPDKKEPFDTLKKLMEREDVRENLSSALSMKKPGVKNRSIGCGSAAWRKAQSRKDLKI